MSRIICHAAMLKAPCGAGPMASETEHWGQKLTRRADDFCRGLSPTVCANTYMAMLLCPPSRSRLQRRQYRFSNKALPVKRSALSRLLAHPAIHKYAERFRTRLLPDLFTWFFDLGGFSPLPRAGESRLIVDDIQGGTMVGSSENGASSFTVWR